MRAAALLLAVTLSCTGCGPIIYAVLESQSSSSSASTGAPTLTAPASVARPAMVDGEGTPSASEVRVDYALIDGSAAGGVQLTALWRRQSEPDGALRVATPAASSEPVAGLAAAPDPGAAHRFVWAAAADLTAAGLVEEDVVLRLQPRRGADVGLARDVTLRVGNTAPAVTIEPVTGAQGRTVLTAMSVRDPSADDSTVELSVEGAVVANLSVGPGAQAQVAGSVAGTRTTIAWDSVARLGLANQTVEVVVTATDRFGLTNESRATIELKNDTAPSAQLLFIGTASGVAGVAGRVPVRFALFDAEADLALDPSGASGRVDVTVEVSGDDGATWAPATGLTPIVAGRPVGLASLAGLAALPPPLSTVRDPANVHTFLWDAFADGFGPGPRTALLRVTPANALPGQAAQAQRRLGESARLFDQLVDPRSSVEVVTGDFDEDGLPDRVFSQGSPRALVFQRGLGDGTFGAATTFPLVGPVMFLGVGDLDGDGHLDFVAPVDDGGRFRLYHGDGLGGFAVTILDLPSGGPTGLVVTDLDGDGRSDCVVSTGFDKLEVLRGSNPTTFEPLVDLPTNRNRLTAGDVNGDGRLDLVAMGFAPAMPGEYVAGLYLGQAGGGFAPEAAVPVSGSPSGLCVADLDGDGYSDLAIPLSDLEAVAMRFGGPTGPGAETLVPVAGDGFQPVAGDLDGDGRLDLVLTTTAGDLVVLRSPGDRAFQVALRLTDPFSSRLALADVDGNGRLDLLGTGLDAISLQKNLGAAGAGAENRLAAGPQLSFPVLALGDLDGDGRPDEVVGNVLGFTVRLAGPGASFGPALTTTPLPFSTFSLPLALADFDGDGRLDLAYVYSATLRVQLGRGDGTFGPAVAYGVTSLNTPVALQLGDLNGDGRVDAVVVFASPIDNVSVLLGVAGGALGPETRYVATGPPAFAPHTPVGAAFADFDRDGDLDVVVVHGSSYVDLLRGDGAGGLVSDPPQRCSGVNAEVTAADLDGDGWPDLVTRTGLVLRNRGGVFDHASSLGIPVAGGVVAADLDGDGAVDLALADGTVLTNRARAVAGRGRGDGRRRGPPSLVRSTGAHVVAGGTVTLQVGDCSGDGVDDLVAVNAAGTQLFVSSPETGSQPVPGLPGARRLPVGPLDLGRAAGLTLPAGTALTCASLAAAFVPETLVPATPPTLTLALSAGLTGAELASGVLRIFRHEPEAAAGAQLDPATGRRVFGRIVEVARTGGGPGLSAVTVDPVRGTASFTTSRLGRFQAFLQVASGSAVLLRETFDADAPDLASSEAPLPRGWTPVSEAFAGWRVGRPGPGGPAPSSAPNLLAFGLRGAPAALPAGSVQLLRGPHLSLDEALPGRATWLHLQEWHDLGASGDQVELVLVIPGTTDAVLRTFTGSAGGAAALAPVDVDLGPAIAAALAVLDPFGYVSRFDAYLELRWTSGGGAPGRGFFLDDLHVGLE